MILLSIGSNLKSKFESRKKNIEKSIQLLKQEHIKIITKSSLYETPSFPNTKNPKFLNIILLVHTNFTPIKLMKIIHKIENIIGRIRKFKNEPRVCDIDIIDYKSKVIDRLFMGQKLIIPHKRMLKREFVLLPLLEVCPEWKHPINQKKISDLVNKIPKNKLRYATKIYFR